MIFSAEIEYLAWSCNSSRFLRNVSNCDQGNPHGNKRSPCFRKCPGIFVNNDLPPPPLSLGEREWAHHGCRFLIYIVPLLAIAGPQSISRDLKQEGQTEDTLCVGGEHKDKTPRFIYAAWRFVTTQGDECLLEARGISSVIMEHINWFCSDFHLCRPELLCSCKKQSSFMMALSWLEKTKQRDDEKFYSLFCCQSDMHWQVSEGA